MPINLLSLITALFFIILSLVISLPATIGIDELLKNSGFEINIDDQRAKNGRSFLVKSYKPNKTYHLANFFEKITLQTINRKKNEIILHFSDIKAYITPGNSSGSTNGPNSLIINSPPKLKLGKNYPSFLF